MPLCHCIKLSAPLFARLQLVLSTQAQLGKADFHMAYMSGRSLHSFLCLDALPCIFLLPYAMPPSWKWTKLSQCLTRHERPPSLQRVAHPCSIIPLSHAATTPSPMPQPPPLSHAANPLADCPRRLL